MKPYNERVLKDSLIIRLVPYSLFHMKIPASVTKHLHQDCGLHYLHFPGFFLVHTLSFSASLHLASLLRYKML